MFYSGILIGIGIGILVDSFIISERRNIIEKLIESLTKKRIC